MYVLSHGCLLSSYKAFFHLHTWFFPSCVLTSNAFFPWETSCYEYFLVSQDVSIYYMLDLADPLRTSLQVLILYPRHYSSWTGTLLPFLLGYFFIVGRICINDVTQQCHITRVCLRNLNFIRSLFILFFILDYFSCPRWYSSLEVDLPFTLYSSKSLSFAMVSLNWEASGSSYKLSLLVLWNDLQVNFSCMIRNIS